MKRKILIILLFGICNLTAQTKLSDINLVRYIENQVSKNIFIYRIINSTLINSKVGSGALLENGYLSVKAPLSFNKLLPNYGEKLIFTISEVNMQYPDTNYKLYSLFKPSESYSVSTLDSLPHIFIDSVRGITILYDPSGVPPMVYNNSDINIFYATIYYPPRSEWQYDFSIYLGAPDRMFLVGIDTTKRYKKIKYISGNFYLHAIADDFKLDINNPDSFYEFLKFKTFKYQTEDITFLEKKDNELVFKAYRIPGYVGSEHIIPGNAVHKQLVHIVVDLDNIEDVKVRYIYDE
jgi:hypothetical protein